MHHENNGNCLECAKILNRYPGFSEELRIWLFAVQLENASLHVSEGGRGRIQQEIYFHRKSSDAHYGYSAHNWNAALDVFFLIEGKYNLDEELFKKIVGPNLYPALNWYGKEGAEFYERPHIELTAWEQMSKDGLLKLVE